MEDKKIKRAEHNSVLDWVIHETAGPLTAVSGYAQLAADQETSEEERREALRIIANESDRLIRLLRDIRNMASLVKGETIRVKEEVLDLCCVLQEGFAVQKNARPGYEYIYRPCSDSVTVLADRDKTVQILLNLMTNSAKYSRRGSEIVLSVSKNEAWGIFSVSDRGCGIAEDELPKIFSLGERLSSSLHTDGRGIGLYLVSELVKAMKGKIEVESSVGEGSTFTVYLPLH